MRLRTCYRHGPKHVGRWAMGKERFAGSFRPVADHAPKHNSCGPLEGDDHAAARRSSVPLCGALPGSCDPRSMTAEATLALKLPVVVIHARAKRGRGARRRKDPFTGSFQWRTDPTDHALKHNRRGPPEVHNRSAEWTLSAPRCRALREFGDLRPMNGPRAPAYGACRGRYRRRLAHVRCCCPPSTVFIGQSTWMLRPPEKNRSQFGHHSPARLHQSPPTTNAPTVPQNAGALSC